jgi:putative transposase
MSSIANFFGRFELAVSFGSMLDEDCSTTAADGLEFVAERFFWSLNHEWTKHDTFHDLEAARLSVFKYVEIFYNPVRLHQFFGYKSPEAFETEYAPVLAA